MTNVCWVSSIYRDYYNVRLRETRIENKDHSHLISWSTGMLGLCWTFSLDKCVCCCRNRGNIFKILACRGTSRFVRLH